MDVYIIAKNNLAAAKRDLRQARWAFRQLSRFRGFGAQHYAVRRELQIAERRERFARQYFFMARRAMQIERIMSARVPSDVARRIRQFAMRV